MAKKKTNKKSNDNTLPILTHILGLFTWFIGPLIVLLASEDKNAKNHSKFALNWQLSLGIYTLASFILMFIFIGMFLAFALSILNIVFSIMAAVKAGNDELWEYPLSIRFFEVKK